MVQANLLDFCVVAESYRSEKRSREIEDRSERDRDQSLITRGDKIPDQMDLKTRENLVTTLVRRNGMTRVRGSVTGGFMGFWEPIYF